MSSCKGATLAALLALSGCELLGEDAYSREPARREDKSNGDIQMEVASGTHATLLGRAPVQSTGSIALTRLPPGAHHVALTRDDDGDGVIDARKDLAVELAVGELANPGLNPFGGVQEDVVAVALLGEVELDETATVRGTALVRAAAVDGPASLVAMSARVVAFRTVELPGGLLVSRGIEAEAVTDDTGAFALEGVGAGEVQIAAFAFDDVAGLGDTRGASTPITVSLSPGQSLSLTDDLIVDVDPALPNVSIFVEAQPAFGADEQVTLRFWRRGSDKRPECVPDANDQEERALGGDPAVIPAGLYDLVVCSSGGAVLNVPGVVAAPGAERFYGGLITLDPVLTVAGDLDEDGVPGLPLFLPNEPVPDAWVGCVAACADAQGADAQATCDFGGETFDCDDDGDGQAEVTEPAACYGPGLGGDRDGDGVCDGDDAYPRCAANDAASCDADSPEHNPTVPAALEDA